MLFLLLWRLGPCNLDNFWYLMLHFSSFKNLKILHLVRHNFPIVNAWWLLLLQWSGKTFERYLTAPNKIAVCKVLHLQFVFMVDFIFFLIRLLDTFLVELRWFMQVLWVHLKFFERTVIFVGLDTISRFCIVATSFIEILSTYLGSNTLMQILSLCILWYGEASTAWSSF